MQYQIVSKVDQNKAKGILEGYEGAELEYLKFLLFPEFCPPVRVPRLFPMPTHMWKDAGSVSITPTTGSAYILWSPKIQSFSPGLGYKQGALSTTQTQFSSQTGEVTVHNFINPPTGFDTQHVQCTAAVLRITYQGDLEDLSGTIDVGIAMHDESSLQTIQCVRLQDIKKTYYYKSFPVGKGCRMIYFPINSQMIEDIGQTNQFHNYAYHVHISGASSDAGSIRLDWEYYFEGNPDFTVHNQYLPKPAKQVDNGLDQIVKLAPKMLQSVSAMDLGSEYGSNSNKWVHRALDYVQKGIKVGEQVLPIATQLMAAFGLL